MPLKLCCSLCLTPTNEYEPLRNDEGDFNDIYEITIKYFDPMLLKTDKKADNYPQNKQVLCQSCWLPIKYFNKFQQNVIKARSLSEIIVEVEDDDPVDAINSHKNDDDNYKSESGDDGGNYEYSNENDYVKPALEADYKEPEFIIKEEEPLTSLHSEKTLVEVECNDIGDEIVNQKNADDNYKSSDDGENYAYSYDGNVYVKPDLNVEPDYEEQEFVSDDDDEKDDDEDNEEYDDKDDDEEDDENDKPSTYSKPSTINNSKVLPQKEQKNIQRKSRRLIVEIHTQNKKIKLNDGDKKVKGSNWEKLRDSDAIIAQWKPILECDLCDETFSSVEKLHIHFKRKHRASFYMKCCERKFHRLCSLVDHIQKHLNPDRHKCDICGKVVNSRSMSRHMKLMHGKIGEFECEFCPKTFNVKKHLIQHINTHATGEKNFACNECGKVFGLEVYLKAHIKRIHNVIDPCDQNVKAHNTSKKHSIKNGFIEKITLTCDVCGMELDSPVSLNNHMAVFHNDSSTVYLCSICGIAKFSAKAVLDHKKWVHDGIHKCSYCDKPFKNSKDLSEHVAIHTGHDLYQCPHCPQTFRARSTMCVHRKKVHPIEFEKARKNRLKNLKVDISLAQKQVVL